MKTPEGQNSSKKQGGTECFESIWIIFTLCYKIFVSLKEKRGENWQKKKMNWIVHEGTKQNENDWSMQEIWKIGPDIAPYESVVC